MHWSFAHIVFTITIIGCQEFQVNAKSDYCNVVLAGHFMLSGHRKSLYKNCRIHVAGAVDAPPSHFRWVSWRHHLQRECPRSKRERATVWLVVCINEMEKICISYSISHAVLLFSMINIGKQHDFLGGLFCVWINSQNIFGKGEFRFRFRICWRARNRILIQNVYFDVQEIGLRF